MLYHRKRIQPTYLHHLPHSQCKWSKVNGRTKPIHENKVPVGSRKGNTGHSTAMQPTPGKGTGIIIAEASARGHSRVTGQHGENGVPCRGGGASVDAEGGGDIFDFVDEFPIGCTGKPRRVDGSASTGVCG